MFLNGGEREISGGGGYDIVDTVCQTRVWSPDYISEPKYSRIVRKRRKQKYYMFHAIYTFAWTEYIRLTTQGKP